MIHICKAFVQPSPFVELWLSAGRRPASWGMRDDGSDGEASWCESRQGSSALWLDQVETIMTALDWGEDLLEVVEQ